MQLLPRLEDEQKILHDMRRLFPSSSLKLKNKIYIIDHER